MTRIICDLNTIGFRLGEQGSVLVGTLTADTFVSTAKKITDTISDIPDDVLKDNYKLFLKHLETHLKSKDKNSEDSRELIKDFLDSKLKLYEGIEVTVHVICTAAVKVSVESDVESLVSRYEKHLRVERQLEESNAEDEMEIAENGPPLVNADSIIKAALNKYFKENSQNVEWHFTKKTADKFRIDSAVLKRLKSEKSKLCFLDDDSY